MRDKQYPSLRIKRHQVVVAGNMRGAVHLLVYYAWLLCFCQPCLASDTLNAGEKIKSNERSLVSSGKQFELGFFSPPGGTGKYLGIWYYRQEESERQTVVWVANRDKPVGVDSIGIFQIAEDGNLEVVDTSGKSYWSSELEQDSLSINKIVKLMDSGNLVLLGLGLNLWQSFKHPTDTFLPGMKMNENLELTSWRENSDPGRGNFTFKMVVAESMDNRFVILKQYGQYQLYWESERQQEGLIKSGADDMSFEVYALLTNFTRIAGNTSGNLILTNYRDSRARLLMNSTGVLQFLSRDNFQGEWSVQWQQPRTKCLKYNACGNFTSCNDDDNNVCKCLPGFHNPNPIPENGYMGQGEGEFPEDKGCERKSASCGENTSTFLNLVMVKIGNPDEQYMAADDSQCRSICLKMCSQCQAYSYVTPITRRDLSPRACWIWTQNLTTLKEDYLGGYGRSLSVRVDKSDIAPTPKTCEPCGTNMVPYPLSTGPSCGDPMYLKFSCNSSTGQLSFTTANQSYRVTSIYAGSRKFIIQVDLDKSFNSYCGETPKNDENLNISFPFKKTNDSICPGDRVALWNPTDRVEVSWEPPSEPTCTDSMDCKGWPQSSCKATAAGKGKRCLCNRGYHWHADLLRCTQEAVSPNSSLGEPTRKADSKSSLSLILGVTLAGVVILAFTIIFAYIWRRKIAHKQDRESIQRQRGRFYDSERHVKDLIRMEGLEEKDNEGIEVPFFDFESILAATNNFSDANKLGRGGYGPVYKGKLPTGQDIAVKRLSSVSSQGLQEFKNEVVLIAKLQHRNLVRLRGYCIKGDEKILLYEYMPNKSLDLFIFDPTQSVLLDWPMRFDIILGVARGLLYLHQDSRLRVIHRDLKTSNILLDEEMQPKISDFGLARIFGGKEAEGSTERIVGTFGYMSAEYALDGHFSTKSDVFSFGVVLLEIISGKKNAGFYQSKEVSSLLGYAWRLWTEDKLLDLMDFSMRETCNANQFIKCAHIGLLCVQDEPGDRPTMSNIVVMLDSETASLPTPKQPTFFARKDLSSTASSSSKPGTSLQFESSIQEGR